MALSWQLCTPAATPPLGACPSHLGLQLLHCALKATNLAHMALQFALRPARGGGGFEDWAPACMEGDCHGRGGLTHLAHLKGSQLAC